MTTVRLQSALLFAAWFVVIRIASAEAQTVVVGGTTIALPSPEGFFRYDGKNTKVDSLEQQLVPKSNRLLAAFGSEEMLAEVLADRFPAKGRWFNAQSLRDIESIDMTPELFAALKREMRKDIWPQMTDKDRDAIEEIDRKASTLLSGNLKIGEMITLGVFDDTADSFCYSMLGKAQLQATTVSHDEMTIIALCIIRVRNRAFYLAAGSPNRDKSDIEWTRGSVQHWRDAVLKANSR